MLIDVAVNFIMRLIKKSSDGSISITMDSVTTIPMYNTIDFIGYHALNHHMCKYCIKNREVFKDYMLSKKLKIKTFDLVYTFRCAGMFVYNTDSNSTIDINSIDLNFIKHKFTIEQVNNMDIKMAIVDRVSIDTNINSYCRIDGIRLLSTNSPSVFTNSVIHSHIINHISSKNKEFLDYIINNYYGYAQLLKLSRDNVHRFFVTGTLDCRIDNSECIISNLDLLVEFSDSY